MEYLDFISLLVVTMESYWSSFSVSQEWMSTSLINTMLSPSCWLVIGDMRTL